METRICCAYNVSRGCSLSSKVTVVERSDQPLTLMRLLVEGLGFKAETSLWLKPLRSAPMLVRPFPFDLVYLDQDRRVIEAVELLPDVPFPRFDPRVASALLLPVRTISSTGTQKNDELILCGRDELDFRLASIGAPMESESPALDLPLVTFELAAPERRLEPVASASVEAVPVPAAPKPAPIPFLSPPVFGPAQTGTVPAGSGFTVALTTTWHIANSTTAAAVLPEIEIEKAEPTGEDPAASPETLSLELEEEAVAVEDTPARDELPPTLPESVEAERQEEVDESLTSVAATPAESKPEEPRTRAAKAPEIAPVPVKDAAQTQREPFPAATEIRSVSADVETRSKLDPEQTVVNPGDSSNSKRVSESKAPGRTAGTEALETPKPKRPSLRDKAITSSPAAEPEPTRGKSSNKKEKKSFGYLVKEFLNCPDPPPELRSTARLVQQGMIAYDKSGSNPDPMEVRDVSPTGIYLRTRKRWKPGKLITLTIERKGAREHEYNSRVDVQAKTVRCDEGGAGLAWVFPDGIKFDPWHRLHTKRSEESDIQFFIREIRLAKAMGILQRICPLAAEEARHALHDRLSSKRVASAVEIVLQAEDALARNGTAAKVLAHPDVVMRIVESGSWIEDNWIRTLWSGLLVSACSTDGQDTSNLIFIDLLARLTPVHLRILSFVCRKAEKDLVAGVTPGSLDISCTAKELTEAADSQSFARIQQTVGQLSTMGLLVESARPSYVSVMDKVKTTTTPTVLGLKMHGRCNGIRVETP